MFKRANFIIAILSFALIVQVFVQTSAAQCGTNFKTTYRAVNKPNYPNLVAPYRLDDWTGDGRLDYWSLRTNTANSTSDIVIFPSLAAGYWDWNNPIIYTTDIPPYTTTNGIGFFIKDYNSDGTKDLIILAVSNNKVYANNNGTFSGLQEFGSQVPMNSTVKEFIDVNSDGLLDMLTTHGIVTGTSAIGYQLGQANGAFGTRVDFYSYQGSPDNAVFQLADFNGDGKTDLYFSGNGGPKILVNQGNGNFAAGNQLTISTNNFLHDIYDINQDGRADIVTISDSPRKLMVYYGQTDGTLNLSEQSVTTETMSSSVVKAVELNGDNNLDIIEANSKFYNVYLNDGSGGFSVNTYQKSLNPGSTTADLVFSKFSGDNKADILNTQVFNMFGEQVILVKENICQSFGETQKPDIDGDGQADLVTWNPDNGNWKSKLLGYFDYNSPASIATFNWGSGALGDVPAPGDFDGDGKTDYTVYRNSDGKWYGYLSSDSSWFVFKFGLSGDIPIPADYDGGGKTDIAVFRPSDGNWYVWLTESQQFFAVHFGANGDKPVPADYDGDGKTDIAVYRPSEGNWYYIKSSDQNAVVFHWGIATDKPVPADYDGDGKADLTVYRDGDWYMYRSSNSSYAYLHLGNSTDIPMSIYRNAEIAGLMVYRSSNTFWYMYNRNLTSGVAFGETGQSPVYFGLPNN